MQFLVNGQVFDDISKAKEFEDSLKKNDIDRYIKDAIENNVNIVKVHKANGEDDFFAVGIVDSSKADVKLATFAYVECMLGKRYSVSYDDRYLPVITENYSFVKMTSEELSDIQLALYEYLQQSNRVARTRLYSNGKRYVLFFDFLDAFGKKDEPIRDYGRTLEPDGFEEFRKILASISGVDIPFLR